MNMIKEKENYYVKKFENLPIKLQARINNAMLNHNQIQLKSQSKYKRIYTEIPKSEKKQFKLGKLFSYQTEDQGPKQALDMKKLPSKVDIIGENQVNSLMQLYEDKKYSMSKIGNIKSIFNPSVLIIDNKYIGDYLSDRFTGKIKNKCLKDLDYILKIRNEIEKSVIDSNKLNMKRNKTSKYISTQFKSPNSKYSIKKNTNKSFYFDNKSKLPTPSKSVLILKDNKNLKFDVKEMNSTKETFNTVTEFNTTEGLNFTKNLSKKKSITENLGRFNKLNASKIGTNLTPIKDLKTHSVTKGIIKNQEKISLLSLNGLSYNRPSEILSSVIKTRNNNNDKDYFTYDDNKRILNNQSNDKNYCNSLVKTSLQENKELGVNIRSNNIAKSNKKINFKLDSTTNENEGPLSKSNSKVIHASRKISRNKLKVSIPTRHNTDIQVPSFEIPNATKLSDEDKILYESIKIKEDKKEKLQAILSYINKNNFTKVQELFNNYAKCYWNINDFNESIKK